MVEHGSSWPQHPVVDPRSWRAPRRLSHTLWFEGTGHISHVRMVPRCAELTSAVLWVWRDVSRRAELTSAAHQDEASLAARGSAHRRAQSMASTIVGALRRPVQQPFGPLPSLGYRGFVTRFDVGAFMSSSAPFSHC